MAPLGMNARDDRSGHPSPLHENVPRQRAEDRLRVWASWAWCLRKPARCAHRRGKYRTHFTSQFIVWQYFSNSKRKLERSALKSHLHMPRAQGAQTLKQSEHSTATPVVRLSIITVYRVSQLSSSTLEGPSHTMYICNGKGLWMSKTLSRR